LPVQFRGLVGKSFRPPELHEQQQYIATKVDSWCLGWSTFYLLTAQPLFMSADPAQQDQDWLLFQQGDFASLFQQKCNLCSPVGLDFIFRLLQIEPKRRMSISDALSHSWLADPSIAPVLAPKEFWPDSLRNEIERDRRPIEVADVYDETSAPPVGTATVVDGPVPGQISPGQISPASMTGMQYANELPTWASANNTGGVYKAGGSLYGGVSYQSQSAVPAFGARVLSPPRSPRSPRASGPQRLPFDRFGMDDRARSRYPGATRLAHVISTTHSPAPSINRANGGQVRTASPLQREFSPSQPGPLTSSTGYSNNVPMPTLSGVPGYPSQLDSSRPPMLTPRSGSARSPSSPLSSAVPPVSSQASEVEERVRGRAAWTFRNEGKTLREAVSPDAPGRARALSPFGNASGIVRPNNSGSGSWQVSQAPFAPSRNSPQRGAQNSGGQGNAITFPRSISPGEVRAVSPGNANLRTLSPGVSASRLDGMGFSWSTAPPPLSPRSVGNTASTATLAPGVSRISSPSAPQGGVSRIASPGGGLKQAQPTFTQGFAWSPEPPSPRTSPRSYSPGPIIGQPMKIASSNSALPRWPM
jgi:serine/threonine protein kinase